LYSERGTAARVDRHDKEGVGPNDISTSTLDCWGWRCLENGMGGGVGYLIRRGLHWAQRHT